MLRPRPRSTLTDTLLPYTSLCRSADTGNTKGCGPFVPEAKSTAPCGPPSVAPDALGASGALGRPARARPSISLLPLHPAPRRRGRPGCSGNRLRLERRRKDNGLHSRSEEHTSELQSLMRISYAVFCLKKKKTQ